MLHQCRGVDLSSSLRQPVQFTELDSLAVNVYWSKRFKSGSNQIMHGSTLTLSNKSLVYTPVGVQCFDLLGHALFQALVAYLLGKGQSLAGPLQEKSFWGSLSLASPRKIRDSCSPKDSNASWYLGHLVQALVLSLAPIVFKGGGVIRSQHSIYMLTGPVLQQQQQHYKTIQISCPNWAATFRFGIGKSFQKIIASRTFIDPVLNC